MNRPLTGGILLVLLALPGLSRGQLTNKPKGRSGDCTVLEEPARKPAMGGGVVSYEIDSVALRRELDSAYARATGRWRLTQIRSGWAGPKVPDRPLEIAVDARGQATIYEQGKPTTAFQFVLTRGRTYFLSAIDPQGQSFFSRRCRSVYVGLCPNVLVLRENINEGVTYVFGRSAN